MSHCVIALLSNSPGASVKQAVSFTQDPVGHLLYRMSLPMVWGLLATMSFNAVDTYFVAQLGEESLAAMSFTFPVVMVVTSMAIGLGAGTSSVIARLLGQQRTDYARRLAADSLLLSTLLSIVMVVIGLLTIEPLFLLLGASPELIPEIASYMRIWYLSAPFIIIPMTISALMRATGNNMVWGILMIVAAVLNGILDPILIFGWGPIPRMEIEGAAWATLLTRLLLVAGSGYYVLNRLKLVSMPHTRWQDVREAWASILHIGIPAMATNMIIPFASGITVALVANYGLDAVAGFGVAQRIEPVVLIAFYALSGVIGPFFGQNMAQQYQQRQKKALLLVMRFCLGFGLAIAILLWLVAEPVSAWFSDSPQVVAVSVAYLMIVPVSYGLYGLVMSINATFNGLGKPMPSVVISVMRVLGFYLPLVWLGQHLWGLNGLFAATGVANILAGLLGYFWLRRTLKDNQLKKTTS
ncbi:MAG: MATE family efflux transporter [Candidatus Pelagadaptatus aseana]